MTEDILDLDKLRKHFAGWEQVQRLIQEVEKLRSPSYYRKYMRVATPQDYVEQKKKIEKLKAENAELKEALMHENKQLETATIKHLKAQLSESQNRVKELEDGIEGLNEDEFGRKL